MRLTGFSAPTAASATPIRAMVCAPDVVAALQECGLIACAALRGRHLVHASPRFLALFGLDAGAPADDMAALADLIRNAARERADAEVGIVFRCTAEHFDETTRTVEIHAQAVRAGVDCHELVVPLENMMRFLRRHFATEERLMLRVPGAWDDGHRREHRRLLQDIGRLTAVVDEQSVALAVRYLYDWLFRHVDQYDRTLGAALSR